MKHIIMAIFQNTTNFITKDKAKKKKEKKNSLLR